jgi:hypothetical protein
MGSDERIAFTATFDTASPWDVRGEGPLHGGIPS